MTYKGYTGKYKYDDNTSTFHGRIDKISEVMLFKGVSMIELVKDFHNAVDEYLYDHK